LNVSKQVHAPQRQRSARFRVLVDGGAKIRGAYRPTSHSRRIRRCPPPIGLREVDLALAVHRHAAAFSIAQCDAIDLAPDALRLARRESLQKRSRQAFRIASIIPSTAYLQRSACVTVVAPESCPRSGSDLGSRA
jgi:hypothetical protein